MNILLPCLPLLPCRLLPQRKATVGVKATVRVTVGPVRSTGSNEGERPHACRLRLRNRELIGEV